MKARIFSLCLFALAAPLLGSCGASRKPAATGKAPGRGTPAPRADLEIARQGISRDEFNRLAFSQNLSLYWAEDADKDGAPDPAEILALLFGPPVRWTDGGGFTPEFHEAVGRLIAARNAPEPAGLAEAEKTRRRLVLEELAQGRPVAVVTDMSGFTPAERAFAQRILAASRLIDQLYARQRGIEELAARVPADDPPSQALFRRNWGPQCVSPRTEKNPACSAIPGAPKPRVTAYPAELQEPSPGFCVGLEKRKDSAQLLTPFTVVRTAPGGLKAVPYDEAYADLMSAIAIELRGARAALGDTEPALRAYLDAAAAAFETNDWNPADEAWAAMNASNSRFYLRIGPDEVYWEPCAHKAGFHVTFARINRDSLAWQEKLAPVQQEMEDSIATAAGSPYRARKVTFHLPDFIDIVWNAGDDRSPTGATIGQSLPNWGPVVAEGRGRTVAMSNINTDPDSRAMRQTMAASLLTAETMKRYAPTPAPGLLLTILHEACHNLGPSHEYRVKGKTDSEILGGPLSSVMEELKAQSGALFLIEFARKRGLISDELAAQAYVDNMVWAFGHVSQGMMTGEGEPKPYSQLSAVQLGFLLDEGALTWDAKAPAANGKDTGAMAVHLDRMVPATEKLMATVGGIKAQGDRAAAEKLLARYVKGPVVPQTVITERALRNPRATFVYALEN